MINRGATLFGRMAAIFAFLLAFTACGGGGGGGFLGQSGDSAIVVTMTLLDSDGQPTDRVTASEPGTLLVKITEGSANGNVLAGVVVEVQTDIGLIVPASGTALTDAGGVASFVIEAGDVKGAGTLSATGAAGEVSFTGNLTFQAGDSGLRLGYFDENDVFVENAIFIEPKSKLAAGGNAQLSVVVLNKDGARVTTAEDVRFTSGCIAAGQATINPTDPKSVNGQASTLYTAVGCSGLDEITATTVGASSPAFGTLSIASPQANAVNFVSATPELIVLRGTGGQNRLENSEVIFRVVDGNGLPLQGTTVDFSLTTFVGGLALSTTSSLSDGEGQVKVTVQAGNVATVLRVIASIESLGGEVIATVSDLLTVTTGLPDQNSISLSVAGCTGEDSFVVDAAFTIDGLCRMLTVAMADKFNNPVVDGTAAVFTTEYGSIVGSCATTAGTCSVEWHSQQPRLPTLTGGQFIRTIYDVDYSCPSHNGHSGPCPDDLGFIRGARSDILVHAIGEESFIDRNGNGLMDESEKDLFENLPEAFLDNNEDGVYTPALPECLTSPGSLLCISGQEEIFIDFNNNNAYDLNNAPAVFNGLLCPPEGDGNWCSRELVHVRARHTITLGNGPNWDIIVVAPGGNVLDETSARTLQNGVEHDAYISDNFNNPPPAGATVKISTKDNCVALGQTDFEIPNFGVQGAYGLPVTVETDPAKEVTTGLGTVTITLTTPETSYEETYNCGSAPLNCSADFSPPDPRCPPVM